MTKKYIEINPTTRRYLLRNLWRTDKDDPNILRGLIHTKDWWAKFNTETSENKRKLLSFVPKHKMQYFEFGDQ